MQDYTGGERHREKVKKKIRQRISNKKQFCCVCFYETYNTTVLEHD